eukprot:TRINITY_DN1251_c0_g1_i1.p1 TRINITY_DN1251_c0_g1~~TRINITY_DN1251_c0_g1_i1.p1  ORF type:complete len:382 (+),score=71.84 TRINITY_DN1251_c0_g1_i1:45-1190(+)
MRFDLQLNREGRSNVKAPQLMNEGKNRVRRKEGVGRALAAAGVAAPSRRQVPVNNPYPSAIGQGDAVGGAKRATSRSRSVPTKQEQQQVFHPPPLLQQPPPQQQQLQQQQQQQQQQPDPVLMYTGQVIGGGYTSTPRDAGINISAPNTPASNASALPPKAKRRSVSTGSVRPPRKPSPGTFCQEQPQKVYTKYNYGVKRDPPPVQVCSTPVKQRERSSTPQRAPSPQTSNRVPDADGAWERLVQLAKDDFSGEELAMLYWDTLSKLLMFYRIEEPMEVARIELTWKEIQAARSAAATEQQSQPQQPSTPISVQQKGCRDHASKPPYTPYTYTVVRDQPSVTRNTRSGTPVVTPQQESDARRGNSLGRSNMRSCSPAQRPWM